METWMPSFSGKPIELLAPKASEVDFRDIADALAHLNRYHGNARTPVSVGLHKLIGVDEAPEGLKAHWLLHDAHEHRVGEHATPAKNALAELMRGMFGTKAADNLREAMRQFAAIHDGAIYRAAGLNVPTTEQLAAIRALDLRCLATERRDFLAEQTRRWGIDEAGILPFPKARKWKAPDRVADALFEKFTRYLPALQGRSGRAAY